MTTASKPPRWAKATSRSRQAGSDDTPAGMYSPRTTGRCATRQASTASATPAGVSGNPAQTGSGAEKATAGATVATARGRFRTAAAARPRATARSSAAATGPVQMAPGCLRARRGGSGSAPDTPDAPARPAPPPARSPFPPRGGARFRRRRFAPRPPIPVGREREMASCPRPTGGLGAPHVGERPRRRRPSRTPWRPWGRFRVRAYHEPPHVPVYYQRQRAKVESATGALRAGRLPHRMLGKSASRAKRDAAATSGPLEPHPSPAARRPSWGGAPPRLPSQMVVV
jgi:hypothetical protein